MAYVGSALTLVTASVEGTFNVFAYVTADTIATVTTGYYFSDGIKRGLNVGDWIFCAAAGYPFLMYVTASRGFACAAEVATLAAAQSSLEFSETANFTPSVPGVYWLNASNLTLTIPAVNPGGDIVIVDKTGAPNLTISGSLLNGLPVLGGDGTFILSWSALYNGVFWK